jgi:hypothetical protein|nr:MAG TPA: hypothetical protein [Caudoviricetes sp.]
MKLAIHDISIIGVVDNENVRLRVEYTPDDGQAIYEAVRKAYGWEEANVGIPE